MSPTEQQPINAKASETMELPRVDETVQTAQPSSHQAMDPQRPHADSEMSLRGGDGRGGPCPGRFCFIIPCPIPCDCCIIPIPCC